MASFGSRRSDDIPGWPAAEGRLVSATEGRPEPGAQGYLPSAQHNFLRVYRNLNWKSNPESTSPALSPTPLMDSFFPFFPSFSLFYFLGSLGARSRYMKQTPFGFVLCAKTKSTCLDVYDSHICIIFDNSWYYKL